MAFSQLYEYIPMNTLHVTPVLLSKDSTGRLVVNGSMQTGIIATKFRTQKPVDQDGT
ncbi:hypothetical protein GJ744_010773 [Endocarpon pusillum]|uniref:Uncharacterized protein n=1 Tax=Endocarpon pusillum TaxID=364733 RepID=A0A8H7ALC0_9EURO|nr:hypothetical protein GJ744_010773 [Endocarpon pusillum]